MRRSIRLVAVAAAATLTGALGLAIAPGHALALAPPGSGSCSDNQDDVSILTKPVTLGLEVGYFSSTTTPHVALCYGTGPVGSSAPTLTGGAIAVDVLDNTYSNPNGNTVNVACIPDPNATVSASCDLGTAPVVSLAGSNLTFSIPFTLCPGVGGICQSNGPGYTGAIVGAIAAVPCGATCVQYSVTSLCVGVDGIQFCQGPLDAGAGLNGGALFNTLPGPTLCLLGNVCLPVNPPSCVSVGGNPLATPYIPGLPPETITPPYVPVFNSGTAC